MVNKKLNLKAIKSSISVGEDMLIPYNNSEVYAEFDNDELYILIKNNKDPEKYVKLFFKENILDSFESVNTEDDNNKSS